MCGSLIESHRENAVFIKLQIHPRQLTSQPIAVGRVELEVFIARTRGDLAWAAHRDDAPVVEDAQPISLFGLLQVMGREEHGDAVLFPHLAQVGPETPPARHIQAASGLIQKQHLRPMHEAADDLELPLHSTRQLFDRPEHLALHTQDGGQIAHLRAIRGGHQPEGRSIRVQPVEDGVKAHVLLA